MILMQMQNGLEIAKKRIQAKQEAIEKENLITGWELFDIMGFIGTVTLTSFSNIFLPQITVFNSLLGLCVAMLLVYIMIRQTFFILKFSAKFSYWLGLISKEVYEKRFWQ